MFALAFFAAAGPLATDMYLPGLPSLREDLGTSPALAQLTISGFMVGMAVGNLLFGPISDATGRKRPAYIGYMAAGALGFGALFAYISASPLVLQNQLGFSPHAYALTFGTIALLLPASNAANMRLVKRAHPRKLLVRALLIDAAAAVLLTVLAVTNPKPWLVIPLLAVLAAMSGFITANASALAVDQIRDIGAGAGTGAMGFIQFVVAAVVAPAAGIGDNHALAMALASLTCAGLAIALVETLTRAPGRR